jgi:hypothetical protein
VAWTDNDGWGPAVRVDFSPKMGGHLGLDKIQTQIWGIGAKDSDQCATRTDMNTIRNELIRL